MLMRFTEEKIIKVLKERENGEGYASGHGISEQTYYRWKSKCDGMEISEAWRLRELKQENHEFKQMIADLMLDNKCCRTSIRQFLS